MRAILLLTIPTLLRAAIDTVSMADDDGERRRLPQAIIIGVKKCGTRALLEYLRINAFVAGTGPEIHFFDRYYERGIDWYRRQMPTTQRNQTTIEKTPAYFITKTAPQRVYNMNPHVKLIIVVRDPVERALSDYAQTSTKRVHMPPFEKMAFLDEANSTHADYNVNKSWGAIRLGIYHRHLARWLKVFPLKQIHVVDGVQLIHDPVTALRQVEKFLGLPPRIGVDDFVLDQNKRFPCIRTKYNDVHCLGSTKGRPHAFISDHNRWRLRQFYAPHNERFFAMVNRRFLW